MINKLFITIFMVGLVNALGQKKLVADKTKSTMIYAMSHPMHDWTATSKDVNSAIVLDQTTNKITQVAAVMKISSFDSGNANRDSHAIEVLEALKHPKVTFTSSKIEENDGQITAIGNLNFHGISKQMRITANKEETGKSFLLKGDFTIKMTDFQVERPSLLGVKTADEIKLAFNLIFTK